jgi:dihydrodipicolinate synthase/N-acetylneuraminate lyase
MEYIQKLPQDFAVFTGSIQNVAACAPQGMAGVISPPLSPFPELTVALWKAAVSGDKERTAKLQQQADGVAAAINKLGATYGRSVARELLRWRGFPVKRYPRWPSRSIEGADLEAVQRLLDMAGVPMATAKAAPRV